MDRTKMDRTLCHAFWEQQNDLNYEIRIWEHLTRISVSQLFQAGWQW